MSKTKIACNVHWIPPRGFKDFIDQNKDIYMPICGGSHLKDSQDEWIKKNILMDDCKPDNISILNPILNELTTLYLVYKNLELVGSAANIGLCHYRRLFPKDALMKIDTCDGIIAKPIPLYTAGYSTNIKLQYHLCHYAEDFDILEQTIIDAGLMNEQTWDEWCNLRYLYAPCQCFVMKREVFNWYCKDLFKIVLQLPSKINLEGRDDYQKRACGFLAERFLSYWCYTMKAIGKMRWIETPLEEHLDWKPEGATDKRGMTKGVFTGDQSLPKIYEWLKTKRG